ncbi:MAG: hypothetical protein P4N60_01890 [Verrucomicrobiae bacterium]|nr:hypothetical protein [Verrucomicrobiae bacterium]
MKKIIYPALVCGCLGAARSAEAQNPAAGQQADAWRFREALLSTSVSSNAAPELYSGETSDVGPQTLLQLKQRRHYIRAFGDEQMFYTDNVFLADKTQLVQKGQQSSDVLVSTVQVALAPDAYDVLGGQLSPEIGYQHQWFTYGLISHEQVQIVAFSTTTSPRITSIDVFDFNVQTIFGGATWRRHNWDFSLGTDFRRFLDSGNYNEFYREIAPRWAAHYTFPLADNKSITVGYEGDYRFTTTQNAFPANTDDYNDRTDHSFVLSGDWWLCPHAGLQPFYRLQYSAFTHVLGGREDLLNSFGIALQLPFTRNIALRTYISYDILQTSGQYVQSYSNLDVGGGLNLSVRF